MGFEDKDIPYTTFQGSLVPLPFFEDTDGNTKQVKGDKAPFVQIVGADGVPNSISNPLSVHVQGMTLSDGDIALGDVQSKVLAVTYHKAVSVAAEGTNFMVDAYKTLTIEIYGTSMAREVRFYGKSASGTKRLIQGKNLLDFSMATSMTNNNEIWSFDITGLEYVIMEVVSIFGGNITIKGKVVA